MSLFHLRTYVCDGESIVSSPLVSAAWLEDHLADPDLRIIEVCSVRDDKIYREGHIPGAMWVYWKSACWHETDRDFITPAALAKMLGGMGIGPQSTVVLYGDPVQYGRYAFRAFTMAGHAKLRLLDGGRRKWVMEGRPLSQTVPHFPAIAYPAPEGTSSMRVGRRDVRDKLGQPRRLLLDFRSPEEDGENAYPIILSKSITAPNEPDVSPAPSICISRSC